MDGSFLRNTLKILETVGDRRGCWNIASVGNFFEYDISKCSYMDVNAVNNFGECHHINMKLSW